MDAGCLPTDVAVGANTRSDACRFADVRMKLRYGFNQTVGWRQFALGPGRERIQRRLQEVDTQIVRIFTFTEYTPDPEVDWPAFAAYIQAVLNAGAVPMITFVRLPQPQDSPRSIRAFGVRCATVAARCVDTWGGAIVRDWAWAVGNNANSAWTSGGLTFDDYRRIYEEAAIAVADRLRPCLDGRGPMIGGPGVDGFQPFWMDWIWRFVHEIDNALIGFVAWNRYGDWREPGAWGAPGEERAFRRLLMSRTSEYAWRAQSIARAIERRGILNVCTELNAHAHHQSQVSGRFNQTIVGATYYASALIGLMRTGVDAEMHWAATDADGRYGAIDQHGCATPVHRAKRLCTAHVRQGDRLEFPKPPGRDRCLDLVVASGEGSRRSAFIAHVRDEAAAYSLSGLSGLSDCSTLLTLDGDGLRVVESTFHGVVRFQGYGVAVVTNWPTGLDRP